MLKPSQDEKFLVKLMLYYEAKQKLCPLIPL